MIRALFRVQVFVSFVLVSTFTPGLALAQDASGGDAVTARDAGGEDRPQCEPVCLDNDRLFACDSRGNHVAQACPPLHYCENAECKQGETLASDADEDDGGCGCSVSQRGPAGLGLLALLLVFGLRRRR